MAGLAFWSVDPTSRQILRPDGSVYNPPYTGVNSITAAGTAPNFDIAAVGITGNQQVFTTSSTINSTANDLVIADRVITFEAAGTLQVGDTSNTDVWFVNCTFVVDSTAGQTIRLRPGSLLGVSPFEATLAPIDLDNKGAQSTMNLLGCTVVQSDGDTTILPSFAEDCYFHNAGRAAADNVFIILPHAGGQQLNCRYDNTRQVGNNLLRYNGTSTITLEGPEFSRMGPILNTGRVAGDGDGSDSGLAFDPIISIEDFEARPRGSVNATDFVSFIRCHASGGGTASTLGFELINPRTWADLTPSLTGNNLAGQIGAGFHPNGFSRANARVVLSARYNPVFYDDATLTGDAQQTAGVPNVHVDLARGFNFNASGRVLDINTTPLATPTRTQYTTDASGRVIAPVGTYNPNALRTDGATFGTDAGGITRAIAAGDGLNIPYVWITGQGAPGVAGNLQAAGRVYESVIDARSFTHIVNSDTTRRLVTTIAHDEESGANGDIGGNGFLVFEDTAISAATATIGAGANAEAALGTHFDTRFVSGNQVTAQDIYELVKFIHTYSTDGSVNVGGAITVTDFEDHAPIAHTLANGTQVADLNFNIDFAPTQATAFVWDQVGNRLLLRADAGLAAPAEGSPIQGLRLTPNRGVDAFPTGTANTLRFDAARGIITDTTVFAGILTGLLTTGITASGGALMGTYDGSIGDSLIFEDGTDLTGFTPDPAVFDATNQLTLSGDFSGIPDPLPDNIVISSQYTVTGLAVGDFLGVYDVTGNTLSVRGTSPGLLEASDLTNGTFTTTGLNAGDTLRYVVTTLSANDFVADITVSATAASNTSAFPRTPQSIPATVVGVGTQVATGTIAAGEVPAVTTAFTGVSDAAQLRVLFTNADPDYQLSPSQTGSLILRGVKTDANYNRVVAERNTNDNQLIRGVGATSAIQARGANVTVDVDPNADSFQAIGFVQNIRAPGDDTSTLTVATLGDGQGVLIYPASEFDLPITLASLEGTVSSETYIMNVTNPAINAIRNFLQLADD